MGTDLATKKIDAERRKLVLDGAYCRTAVPGRDWAMWAAHLAGPVW